MMYYVLVEIVWAIASNVKSGEDSDNPQDGAVVNQFELRAPFPALSANCCVQQPTRNMFVFVRLRSPVIQQRLLA